jgi:hypothetical protein
VTVKRLFDRLLGYLAGSLMFIQARHNCKQQRRTIEDALMLMDVQRDLDEHGAWDQQMREGWNQALDAVMERAGVVGCARIVLTIVEQRLDPSRAQEMWAQIAELRSAQREFT